MGKRLVIIALFAAALQATGAGAQNAVIRHDPFFPEGKGAVATSAPEAWGRDPFGNPFAAGAPAQQETGAFRPDKERMLTGIIYGEETSVAIIGGEALRVGDRVGDRKLVEIGRNRVVLVDKSGRREEWSLENYSLGK